MTDIERVASLPERVDVSDTYAQELTDALSLPGKMPPFALRPEQAVALKEAHDCQGLVLSAAVGSGKTITSFLLPTVCGAKTPLLLVPAHLRRKTLDEWQEHAEHWNLVPPIVKSYTSVSRDKSKDGVSRMLDNLSPDCIIADEAHHLGNPDSGVTKKVLRYLKANPECRLYVLTGTLMKNSLMDGWHMCLFALREGSPLPVAKSVAELWAGAVDASQDPLTRKARAKAARLDLLGTGEPRAVLQDRINKTPGYLQVGTKYDGPLSIKRTRIDAPDACLEAIEAAANGVRPDGQPLDLFERIGAKYPGHANAQERTIMLRWRLQQTLFLGYWDKPTPDPPEDWAVARQKWYSFVADCMESNPSLDTPEAVKCAIESGTLQARKKLLRGKTLLKDWLDIRGSYRPNSVPVWLDNRAPALTYAAEWLRSKPRGLVWVSGPVVGERICRVVGLDPAKNFFGAGQGKNGKPMIEHHRGPAVLSMDANKSGRNLQGHAGHYAWCDNLFLLTPSLSGELEQAIGRTHRPGQKLPVTVELIAGLEAHDNAWNSALENAEFIAGMTGDSPKILTG